MEHGGKWFHPLPFIFLFFLYWTEDYYSCEEMTLFYIFLLADVQTGIPINWASSIIPDLYLSVSFFVRLLQTFFAHCYQR